MGLFDFFTKNKKLLQASAIGNITLLNEALSNGANKNYKDKKGWTALMFACDKGYTEVVIMLLNVEVDVNSKNEEGTTALMFAAMNGYVYLMRLLLTSGADVNLTNKANLPALVCASLCGQIAAVKTLLNTGKCKSSDSNAAMLFAASYGQVQSVDFFLKNGVDINYSDDKGQTALFLASKSGQIEVIKLLLNLGVDVNYTPSKTSTTALVIAALNGQVETVKLLLDKGADVKKISNDVSALSAASYGNNAEIVKILLSVGADVNYADKSGFTPLFIASKMGNVEIVKMLLNAGADVHEYVILDGLQITAEIYAMAGQKQQIKGNHAEVIKILEEEMKKRKISTSEQKNESNKQNSQTSSSANLGTRIETQSQSMAYWIGERMANPKKAPFVYYIFNSSREARAALLELPFIHEEHATGKLICDHIFHFGYYGTTENNIPTGKWDAFIAGFDLTHEMWEQIHFAFKKFNGTMKNDLEPDKNVKTAAIQRGNKSKVVFIREDRTNLGTYLTYKAPSKADAMAFLSEQRITQRSYYVVVETPEGNYGKDIQGIYKE